MLNSTQKQCNKTAKYASDFIMLPTYTYPEILTAKCLLSNADFIFHHPPFTTWSNNVIRSGKLGEWKPEPWKKILNGNLPQALQIFELAPASWVWIEIFVLRIRLDREGSLKSQPEGSGTEHTVYSPLKRSSEGLLGRGSFLTGPWWCHAHVSRAQEMHHD